MGQKEAKERRPKSKLQGFIFFAITCAPFEMRKKDSKQESKACAVRFEDIQEKEQTCMSSSMIMIMIIIIHEISGIEMNSLLCQLCPNVM
jgi:hypothetical protein